MSMKERILEMPVWKAAVSAFIIIIFSAFMIENLFVHLVFLKINSTISYFEKIDKEDRGDIKKDSEVSQEKIIVINEMKAYQAERAQVDKIGTDLEKYCFYLKSVDRLHKIRSMKGHATNNDIPFDIGLELISLSLDVDHPKSGFNPQKCEA